MTHWLLPLVLPLTTLGWEPTATAHGCAFFKGPAEGPVVPVRAECTWDLPAPVLHRLLADAAAHHQYFSTLVRSPKVSDVPGGMRVLQLHRAAGIADREVVMRQTQEVVPGGVRYRYQKDPDQSEVSGEHVMVARSEGFWEVTGDRPLKLVYELRYEAGGSVPGFLVRWFQGAGVRDVLGELYSHAQAATPD